MRVRPVFALLWLLMSACTTSLKPAEHASRTPGDADVVESQEQGVRGLAQASAFPGEAYIEAEVTPLHVKLFNESGHTLYIRYDSFRLEDADGKTYPAIPPHDVRGTVPQGQALPPSVGYSRFEIAPHYRGYYPWIDAYRGPFDYDIVYYDNTYGYWQSTAQLPTPEMLRRALPEGALLDGGDVEGFLYFPKLDLKEGTEVTLRAQLQGEGSTTTLQFPFVLE